MLDRLLTAVGGTGRGPRITGYPGVLLLGLVWIFIGTLAYVRHQVTHGGAEAAGGVLPEYLLFLTCFLPWIGLSGLVFGLERRFPLGGAGWARHLLVLAAFSVPVTTVAAVLMLAIGAAIRLALGLPAAAAAGWLPSIREVGGHQSLYWGSVAAGWVLRALLDAREAERRAARLMLEKSQLETSLRQAELDVLRMRLDPHFLFNSLQNISVLTLQDPQTGSRMLTRLGDLLRVSLRRDGRPETTLQAEAALTEAYLAIEQMRFGDRLTSLVDLAPGTERALVPSFLLQPLVENAIRHGLRDVRDGGIIAIRSRREGDALVLTVADNGSGPPADGPPARGAGIGLGATCERLARLYPGAHAFALQALPEGGTEVRVRIPFRTDAAMEAPRDAHAATADR